MTLCLHIFYPHTFITGLFSLGQYYRFYFNYYFYIQIDTYKNIMLIKKLFINGISLKWLNCAPYRHPPFDEICITFPYTYWVSSWITRQISYFRSWIIVLGLFAFQLNWLNFIIQWRSSTPPLQARNTKMILIYNKITLTKLTK